MRATFRIPKSVHDYLAPAIGKTVTVEAVRDDGHGKYEMTVTDRSDSREGGEAGLRAAIEALPVLPGTDPTLGLIRRAAVLRILATTPAPDSSINGGTV